ncbi:hypothetical protein [Brevibacterium zhoupengii]|uniref:hypothetical protein n=1 Tax=Brevibacterium zhoupengii TaxID=2898795 RepID=UPI001F097D85|nr:hypothetical protein [Brevibacterium zhoupengii]
MWNERETVRWLLRLLWRSCGAWAFATAMSADGLRERREVIGDRQIGTSKTEVVRNLANEDAAGGIERCELCLVVAGVDGRQVAEWRILVDIEATAVGG